MKNTTRVLKEANKSAHADYPSVSATNDRRDRTQNDGQPAYCS